MGEDLGEDKHSRLLQAQAAVTRRYFNNSYQNIIYLAPPLLDIYLKDIVVHL